MHELLDNLMPGAGRAAAGLEESRRGELVDERLEEERSQFRTDLGGGISEQLLRGRIAGRVEKTHLVLKRLMAERAQARGIELIDLGTDGHYPFFDGYEATEEALAALGASASGARSYPSSFGLLELREEVACFCGRYFHVELDPAKETLITTGASQAFDALSRTFAGEYFLLPELALTTVNVVAIANGAKPLRVPLQPGTGLVDVDAAARLLERLGRPSVRFLYVNYPNNPTGAIAPLSLLEELVAFGREFRVLVVHDMDSWFQRHVEEAELHNILEVPGGRDVALTILSLSKEFGLPGLRIGFAAGNADVVNALRIHNSEFCVMLPEPCQQAALAALRAFRSDSVRFAVSRRVTEALDYSIESWHRLGWPCEAIKRPTAGYKYLIRPPRRLRGVADVSAVELFDYFVASRAFVKLSTSRSFNDDNVDFFRVVVMQDLGTMREVFRRLEEAGVHYDMELPDDLASERETVVGGLTLAEL